MSDAYPHLHPTARQQAEHSNEARIRRIRTDRWITYARAEAALLALKDLLSFPQRTRMPNLLLVGPTNNGKTMIVEKFRRAHLPVAASKTSDGVATVPVLKIQMPAGPDESRFFSAILYELGFPSLSNDRLATRQTSAAQLMRATGVRLLIIDEVHNLLAGSRPAQRRVLNLLRWLGNELQIALVAVGTTDALHAIQSDDQLANRFEPFGLSPWRDGQEYRQLLITLEAILPLRLPSQLISPALSQKILSASEGILGEMIAMMTRAAVHAVLSGAECISAKSLDECGFVPPTQRRCVTV